MNTVSAGYVVTQVPGGAPVAFPMQGDRGMVAVQNVTPRSLEGQAQMVLVPVSGAVGNQASGAMATGYQPEQCGMLSSYAQGQFMTLQNEQVLMVQLVSRERIWPILNC